MINMFCGPLNPQIISVFTSFAVSNETQGKNLKLYAQIIGKNVSSILTMYLGKNVSSNVHSIQLQASAIMLKFHRSLHTLSISQLLRWNPSLCYSLPHLFLWQLSPGITQEMRKCTLSIIEQPHSHFVNIFSMIASNSKILWLPTNFVTTFLKESHVASSRSFLSHIVDIYSVCGFQDLRQLPL